MSIDREQKRKNNPWHEGSIRKRKDGRYEGRITFNRVTKYTYGKTEFECEKKLRAIIRELKKELNPDGFTIYDYCLYYLKNKQYVIEVSTYNRIECIIETQIKDSVIANQRLGNIRSDELQRFFNSLAIDEVKEYSYGTIKIIYTFIAGVFSYAIKNGNIRFNPMLIVRLPKERYCKCKRKETFSLTPEQIKKFKAACLIKNKTNDSYRYRYGIILLLLLNTGIRIGEMLALEWNDIDFDNKIIRINKSMQYNVKVEEVEKRQIYIKEPKTKRSIRVIPINNEIKFILDEIVKMNERNDIVTSFVCSDENGNYSRARSLQRSMKMIIANTDLPDIWIHLLRHTFGSELLRKGVDITIVSRLMGHSNTTTTYNIYIHVLDEEFVKAMDLPWIS